MARPRGRPSKQSASAKSTPAKRAASPETPLRQSKRTKSASTTPATHKSTPKKSVYFEPDSEPPETETESDNDDEASGYEDDDADESAALSPSESEISDEYNSESDRPRKKKKMRTIAVSRGKASAATAATGSKVVKADELWKEGVKVDAEVGQEVFIKLPKARGPGSTPYQDSTIHPNTFLFLADLKQHNERAWLKVHDADYRQAQKDFSSFVECLTEKLIEEDDTVPELPAKDIVFRIYRDVRFSSDPTPYKTAFAAAWSRTGRKGPYAHYYAHIEPGGKNFVGGGLWMPEADSLHSLRVAMDTSSHRLKRVLLDPKIRKHFLDGVGNDKEKAVKAFIKHSSENALKRKPKVCATISQFCSSHSDIF